MDDQIKKEFWRGWENTYIRAYREFSDPKSKELFISPELFYLYSLINVLENINKTTLVTVNLLEDVLPLSYSDNPNYNRKKIKENLSALWEKELIFIYNTTSKKEISSAKLNDRILIEINDNYISSKSKRGYIKLPVNSFIKARTIEDYYIHFSVAKWGSKGFVCSYREWGEILGVSSRAAMDKIEIAFKNNAIFMNVGARLSNTKQETNVYKITSFTEEEKTSETKKKEKKLFKGLPF